MDPGAELSYIACEDPQAGFAAEGCSYPLFPHSGPMALSEFEEQGSTDAGLSWWPSLVEV